MSNHLSLLVRPHRPLQTVLIGSSLESDSDQVVRAGLAVARAAGARVHLVHAVSIEPLLAGFEAGFGLDLVREQLGHEEERLRQQIERLGIAAGELAGATVFTGAPHRILVDAARTARADLIVVGATGCGPLAAELLGSTADRVLHKAPCPVLVVRGELPVPPRRVLAPVDLSTLSGDAFHCGLSLLSQLAKDRPTEVRVAFALSFLDSLAFQREGSRAATPEQVKRHCAEELRRFVLENRPEGPFTLETALLAGDARFEILRELSEHPVDLVVLGTHGRGGLDRLVLGSVASTVARKAPCSVLLLSPAVALGEGVAKAVLAQTEPALRCERTAAEPAPVG